MLLAKKENIHFIETSAKTGDECTKAMHLIMQGMLIVNS
jgi:hypothetical protein